MSLIIGLGGGGGGAAANYKAVIAWDGNSVPVVANIPAGVVVTYNGTQYTGTLAASASTRKYPYLIKSGNVPDAYDEYRTYQDIATSTYFWEKGGSGVDLTGYLKYHPQTLTDEQKLQARSNIGAIALTDVPVDIFTAEYDVDDPTQSTPYADVAAAYTAGKRMQVKAGFDYFPLNSVESNEYCFTGLDAELTAKKYICKTTGWEVSEIEFLTSHQSLSEYRKAANQDIIDDVLSDGLDKTFDEAVSRDSISLPTLCGQPMKLFGAGTPQAGIPPINWKQLADGGYNWNGLPSALGQEYINTSAATNGHYTAVPDGYALKWVNF